LHIGNAGPLRDTPISLKWLFCFAGLPLDLRMARSKIKEYAGKELYHRSET
jgi:hypothetical protein